MSKSIGIYFTFARPGNGKSSDMAKTQLAVFRAYRRSEKKYPALPKRYSITNQKLDRFIEEKEGASGHLFYWESIRQLRFCNRVECWKGDKPHPLHDCDIFIDEIANYFPSDGFRDTPKWFRKLFAQHRHRGLRIFANTQDYKAVDINFRRMITFAYKVRKVFSSRDITATLPPPRFIFGLITKSRFDPDELEEKGGGMDEKLSVERKKVFGGIPEFIWITPKLVSVFDTTQDIPEYQPDTFEHYEIKCPDCLKTEVRHRIA